MPNITYPRRPRGTPPGTIRGKYKPQGLRPQRVVRQKLIAEDIALGLSKMELVDKYTVLWSLSPTQIYHYIDCVYQTWANVKHEDLSYVTESKKQVVADLLKDLALARASRNHDLAIEIVEKLNKINKL